MSRELSLFSTPWHHLVHGLGLGQLPEGFDAARAERVLALSAAIDARFNDPAHHFVDALVRTLVASAGPERAEASSLTARLAGLEDPCEHARACALLIDATVKAELFASGDRALQAHWATAVRRIAGMTVTSDGERYRNLHLLVALFLAAGQAGWAGALAAPSTKRAYLTASRLADSIVQPFYRGRAAAILATALGVLGAAEVLQREGRDRLAELMGLLASEFERFPAYPPDGVHVGRDYRLFPLLLAMTAIGVTDRFDCLHRRRDWLALATHEVRALTTSSRASQVLFYASALRNLGLFERYVPEPAALLLDAAESYLANTDGRRADDYLRCTYLVHLARQLGCTALLPDRVWQILAHAVAQVIGSGAHRENPYASGSMIVAYALSAIDERRAAALGVDLIAAVGRIEDEPGTRAVQLPRLGYALVDAALRLRPADAGDTPLYEAVRIGNPQGDRQWA
jgi:hypothetical protein